MTYKSAIIGIIVILVINTFAAMFGVYELYRWFDIPMHFGGGFVMGMLGIAIFHQGIEDVTFKGRFEKQLKFWFIYAFVIGFVSFVAIVWEIHEFLLDQWFTEAVESVYQGYRQSSIADTMLDFVMGLFGAVVAVALLYKRKK